MQFEAGNIYHVYNRGNYKQEIFFSDVNYLHFLSLTRKFILPVADILAWCLMPNHFHFLIYINERSVLPVQQTPLPLSAFSYGIRMLLSSYTKAINKAEGRHGNLFQQRTKAKLVSIPQKRYAEIAFHYIHQNPLKAGLVNKLEEWQYSSFKDYCNFRKGNLCNKKLVEERLDLDWDYFYENSYAVMDEALLKNIF